MSFPTWITTQPSESSLFIWEVAALENRREELIKNRQRQAGTIFVAEPLVALACSAERMLAPAFFWIQASESQLVRTEGSVELGQFVVELPADCMHFLCSGTCLFLWPYSRFGGDFECIKVSAMCTPSASDEMKAVIWEGNMSSWQLRVKPHLKNDSEVRKKDISLKTQRMKFRALIPLSYGSQMPHRYSSHWQWYLWEPQVCTPSPNIPCPRECLDSDQLLFPSHSAPLLKHEGNSHPRPPLLTLLPLPLAPHTEMWERKGDQMRAVRNEDSPSRSALPSISCHSPSPGLPAWGLLVTCHSLSSLHLFPPLSIPELEKLKMKIVIPTFNPVNTKGSISSRV